MQQTQMQIVKGIGGAVLGAVVGTVAFLALIKIGIYAIIIPGAAIGIGCSWGSRTNSTPLGVMCAISALVVALLAHSSVLRFTADDSLVYFLTHFYKLPPMQLIMIGLGVFAAFYFGRGQEYSRYGGTRHQ